MQEIFNFFVANRRLIIEAILLIVSFVLLIVKKKPVKVIDSVTTFVTSHAVEVINIVEAMAKGSKYIDYHGVITPKIDVAIDLMKEKIKLFIPNAEIGLYDYYIRKVIEDILSTPQKKGGK